ncbi:MAG: hypothetical protein JOZ48_16130 [Acidobacteriaceae bacterium]|nr:hypothetical protein [Acidobacteriaceae bacterium]
MASLSKTTRDPEEIQKWAEERGGKPAHVKTTESGEDIGILRIEFPGFGDREASLEPITWEEFFEKFTDRDLVLIYQEETAEGEKSNFNKLVSAETAAESERGRSRSRSGRGPKKSSTKKAAAKKSAAKTSRSAGSRKAASGSRSSSAKKAAPKKAAAKKTAPVRKGASKKALAKKSGAKKTGPKKVAGKKATTKKAAAKRRR